MLKKFLIGTFAVAAFALVFATASASYDFGPTTLKVGSTGDYVKTLQTFVGASPVDGVFGPMTKAKVMAWQAANGLVADGLFGNLSKAKANLGLGGTGTCTGAFDPMTGLPCTGSTVPGCMAGYVYSPTTGAKCDGSTTGGGGTGTLAGTAGTIDDVNLLSQYNSEEVGEGQNDVKVLGFDVVASNDGDIALNSMKVHFVITNASGSTRLEDYADSVSIWQGSTKVGSADAADFNRDSAGVYTKVVTLSNSVVREDTTEKFYVTIDAQGNLDTDDINTEVMIVDIDNIRYTDGGGVTTTDASTGVINAMNVTVDFVTFSASSDTELKISLNNTPSAGYVKVDSSDDTNDVVLLKGKFKVEGTSDVWMDTLPIQFTATTDDGSIAAITGSVTLTLGSNTYTESVNTTNCFDPSDFSTGESCAAFANIISGILFDNLDYTISAGDTVNFTVSADINNLSNTGAAATDFDAGDSLKAEFTAAARALTPFVVENDEGDALAAGEKTGSALGEAQTFYENGVNVDMGTVTYETVTDGADTTQVTYIIPLTVTAFGDTRYIGLSAEYEKDSLAVDNDLAFAYELQESTNPTTGLEDGTVSSTLESSDGTLEGGTAYRLDEGTATHFTLRVIHTTPGTASKSYRVEINEVQTYSDAALNTDEIIQTLTPTQDFTTGYKFITG